MMIRKTLALASLLSHLLLSTFSFSPTSRPSIVTLLYQSQDSPSMPQGVSLLVFQCDVQLKTLVQASEAEE